MQAFAFGAYRESHVPAPAFENSPCLTSQVLQCAAALPSLGLLVPMPPTQLPHQAPRTNSTLFPILPLVKNPLLNLIIRNIGGMWSLQTQKDTVSLSSR
ncbi:hypothetical protein ACET3X_008883 [Alternaria dauci]|uniref:Uncharacterized protein n=1 Tax=Alternaria dauci TaxID=48095 RepID=A0ABR3U7E7_9PLEO